MAPTKVMVIRHAEKPPRDGSALGIDASGREDADSLSVTGWQRAGALARFFAPRHGPFADPALARPDFIMAAGAGSNSTSLRSCQTVEPLGRLLGIEVDARFLPDQERDAGAAILARHGVGLVAWEHRRISDLVLVLTKRTVLPPYWDSGRFDVVLVLDRDGDGWTLTQVAQCLLPEDATHLLPFHCVRSRSVIDRWPASSPC